MEDRKQKEVEYYDKRAREALGKGSENKNTGDFEGFKSQDLSSFKFFYELLGNNCQGKLVLDYGCGNGIHSAYPLKVGAKRVIGIDLSETSLEIARNRVKKERLEDKTDFLKMDCEKMDFPDGHFDLIMDGGTFSSLDLKRVYPELVRVLKPEGILVGIETFGHNPLSNFKRKLNEVFGKRTSWAAGHIFKEKCLKEADKYFSETKAYFFHPISFLAFPFLHFPGGKIILRLFELVDKLALLFPFFRKYSFKVVFIFKSPKKNV